MSKNLKNALESVKEWLAKVEFIKSQIKSLEGLRQYPIINISLFILKSQLLEFDIKQLITSLDIHLRFANSSLKVKRIIRTPKELDKMRLGLGGLIQLLREFEIDSLNETIKKLNKLNDIRVKCNHYLLDSDTTILNINLSVNEGIKLYEQINSELQSIENILAVEDR